MYFVNVTVLLILYQSFDIMYHRFHPDDNLLDHFFQMPWIQLTICT